MPARNASDDCQNAFVRCGKKPEPYGHFTLFERRATLVHSRHLPVSGNVPSRIQRVVEVLRGVTVQVADGRSAAQLPDEVKDIESLYELTYYKPQVPGYSIAVPMGAVKAPGVLGRLMGSVHGEPLPQRVLACHWSDARVAVVGGVGRVVYVLDTRPHTRERMEDKDFFEVRTDGRVKEIRAVAWRPYCVDTLAAGCMGGVALWENAGRLRMLTAPGHEHVVSVAWCSDGARLLSASAADGQVRLWDVASGSSTVVCPGAALAAAHHSPDLLAAGAPRAAAFRLWHLDAGHSERWGQLCGPPAAMAWCRRKPILVVAPRGEAALHFLSVEEGRDAKLIHSEPTALPNEGPGGTAISIAWDPTGERLAVAYEYTGNRRLVPFATADSWQSDEHGRFAVALYSTSLEPLFSMHPVGYVRGGANGPPVSVDFRARPKGKFGAVLVTAWESGAVTFTHLMFKPSS